MKCDKIGYEKEHHAKRFAEIFRKQGKPMRTYFCKMCQEYHLTKRK